MIAHSDRFEAGCPTVFMHLPDSKHPNLSTEPRRPCA